MNKIPVVILVFCVFLLSFLSAKNFFKATELEIRLQQVEEKNQKLELDFQEFQIRPSFGWPKIGDIVHVYGWAILPFGGRSSNHNFSAMESCFPKDLVLVTKVDQDGFYGYDITDTKAGGTQCPSGTILFVSRIDPPLVEILGHDYRQENK